MKRTPPMISISRSSITSPSKWHVVPLLSSAILVSLITLSGEDPSACLADWDVSVILAPMRLTVGSRTLLPVAPLYTILTGWSFENMSIYSDCSVLTRREAGVTSLSRCCSSKASVSPWASLSRMFRICWALTIYLLSDSGK